MQIGIFAKTFPGHDAAAVLVAAKRAGYHGVQYNMTCSGLDPMPDHIDRTESLHVARIAQDHDLRIHALSGTFNMIHPDPAQRALGQRRLAVMAAEARVIGATLVTLCTGTCDPQDQWRHHPDNASPEAWADLLAAFETAIETAETHGVLLGIEPELANVVNSAAAARRLIDTLQAPCLRIVLDPANLFQTEPDHRDIIAKSIDLLADRIVLAHAKDRAPDGSFVAAGKGVVDFPAFLTRLKSAGFSGPLVTHGLTAAEAPGVATFLKSLI